MRKKWQSKRSLRERIVELEEKLETQVPVNVHLPVNERQQITAVLEADRGHWMRAHYSFKMAEDSNMVEFSDLGVFMRGQGDG